MLKICQIFLKINFCLFRYNENEGKTTYLYNLLLFYDNDSFSSTLIKDSDTEKLWHKSDINNYSHSVPPTENCDEKHAT